MSYPPVVPRDPWIEDEWRLGLGVRRVFARAARRPLLVGALALGLAGAAVGVRALSPPVVQASLYFRLQEGALIDPDHEAQPSPDVAAYIAEVALTRAELEPVLRKHGWSIAWLNRDPIGAMAEFREELVIDVRRNYFIYPRRADDPPRSAQVTLSLVGTDVETVLGVLEDIAAAIQRDQAARRETNLSDAEKLFQAELAQARVRVRAVTAEIAALERARRDAEGGAALAMDERMAPLWIENDLAVRRLVALESGAKDVAFSGAAAEENLGLKFELLDEDLVTLSPQLTTAQLARRGALYFAMSVLVVAAFVGAFDDRVYAAGDLLSRRLPLFGALPRFPGDGGVPSRARTREVER